MPKTVAEVLLQHFRRTEHSVAPVLAMEEPQTADPEAVARDEAAYLAAIVTLQRFGRRRFLRSIWFELVEDVIDWNNLYKALKKKREEREAAVSIIKRCVRRSPATNMAMRVASRAAPQFLMKASATLNAAARGWVARSMKRAARIATAAKAASSTASS